LRENVTSPNGTTAAGLTSLMDGRFQDVVNETVSKAAARSKELSA
jgi:pyrroline-5-carboxylate reductase